jgi:hypothetical protein
MGKPFCNHETCLKVKIVIFIDGFTNRRAQIGARGHSAAGAAKRFGKLTDEQIDKFIDKTPRKDNKLSLSWNYPKKKKNFMAGTVFYYVRQTGKNLPDLKSFYLKRQQDRRIEEDSCTT